MKSIHMERSQLKAIAWKPFFRKYKWWLAAMLLLVVAASGFLIYRPLSATQAAAQTATTAELQTAVASQ